MKNQHETAKILQEDKKRLILELYLKEKFKDTFQISWLNSVENYTHLITAFDFFYNLNSENLELDAIGSSNHITRKEHEEQFHNLINLLDKVVVFSEDVPPVALAFDEKGASLLAVDIKQKSSSVSLQDLHAQSANLGIAEKFLNEDLGQHEWLSDVDLERALTQLGVRDKVHITRLNVEDIGMILHFEREKHQDSDEPYTIPLLINCGSSGSLRSQGSHWTEALVTVNPETNTITIDYSDSMTHDDEVVTNILTDAINYSAQSNVNNVVKDYEAFPDFETKTVNVDTDNLQKDGWSCGYRALYKLLSNPDFPTDGIDVNSEAWQTLINAQHNSTALRNAMYRVLLEHLVVDHDYFTAMELDEDKLKLLTETDGYEINDEFLMQYFTLLAEEKPIGETLTSDTFEEEYKRIVPELAKIEQIKTDRDKKPLMNKLDGIIKNEKLSSDAKIFALLDTISEEYNSILKSLGGKNSKLGKQLKKICEDQFGVELDKDNQYHVKPSGLIARMFGEFGKKSGQEESLLPEPKKTTSELQKTTISAPVLSSTQKIEIMLSPSENSISRQKIPGQLELRSHDTQNRVGTMVGSTQFCYAPKPGGVEPGFVVIDLNEEFFKALKPILLTLDSDKFEGLLKSLESDNLKHKQRTFAILINAMTPKPYGKNQTLNEDIANLCKEIEKAVAKNPKLEAWMYKLDQAEKNDNKARIKTNKEALREFAGTKLARHFSMDNQKQKLVGVAGKTGTHFELSCGWKNGMRPFKKFLHGGKEPDYNGILVENQEALVKKSMVVPGLGKNLIFGIAIGDRDGIGKEAQNKGFAGGVFYGFDYGKPFEGAGVVQSLQDDFSFEDPVAKVPSMFKGSGFMGQARHFMYRNYSIFYDTALSERMEGVHLLKKMITGENPGDEVIKSYPGLRQELNRIQASFPTTEDLLNRLAALRKACSNEQQESVIDGLIIQIGSGKLSRYDHYFAETKIDLIENALKTNMNTEELKDNLAFIDTMSNRAAINNQTILEVFEQRLLLTREEVDFLDKLEKTVSPTSVLSHDGTVFLNHMRVDPINKRIPFQLSTDSDGNYTITTTNKNISAELKEKFGLDFKQTEHGLSCTLDQKGMTEAMKCVNEQYHAKRDKLLVEPTYTLETFPYLVSLVKTDMDHADIGYKWISDGSLSLRITPQSEEQQKRIMEIFKLKDPLEINTANIIIISPEMHQTFQKNVAQMYQLQNMKVEKTLSLKSELQQLKVKSSEEIAREDLLARMENLVSKEIYPQIKDAVNEMGPKEIDKLLQYNDKTLSNPKNIQCIIEDKMEDIKEIVEEIELETIQTSNDISPTIDSTFH